MDHKHFSNVLHDRFIDFPECSDPSLLVDSYVEITSSVFDEVCPLVTREHTIKSRLPWYNDIIHAERRNRRRLERKWKKSNSALDKLNFMAQKDHVNKLITDSKIKYFSEKCTNCNVKDMYATINGLLNKSTRILPIRDSNMELADNLLSFFINKIEKIRSNVCSQMLPLVTEPLPTNSEFSMSGFEQFTSEEVKQIIMRFPSKSCSLDSLPSWLVKENIPILLPVITTIVNASLSTGIFPSNLKHSIIAPVINKIYLDRNDLQSYRPVANIPFVSKVIEIAATCQVTYPGNMFLPIPSLRVQLLVR